MENLGKENFWNPMHEKYPLAVDKFCKWIDEYKKHVNWKELFGEKVKFHDLPYELQMGIMNRFFIVISTNEETYDEENRTRMYMDEIAYALGRIELKFAKQN
jgi:hypothetical protein